MFVAAAGPCAPASEAPPAEGWEPGATVAGDEEEEVADPGRDSDAIADPGKGNESEKSAKDRGQYRTPTYS